MSNTQHRSLFVRAASGVFLAKIFGSGLGLGSQILLARLLGADSYGYYVYSIACSYLVLLVVTMGLDKGALRFVAAYLAREEAGLLRGYLVFARKRVLVAGVSAACIVAAVLLMARGALSAEFGATALVACLILPSSSMAQLSGSALQALRRVLLARATLEVGRPLILLAGIGVVLLFADSELTAPHAMALNVLGHFCTALVLALILTRTVRRSVPTTATISKKKEWSSAAWQMALIGGLHLVVAQTDILMIGAMQNTTQAGIYGVASKVATLAVFGLVAGNAIVAPMISELFARKDMVRLQEVVSLAARATSAVTLVLSVAIVIFRATILDAFGEEFAAAEIALLILLVGQTVNAMMGPVGFIMTMTGHQALAAKVIGMSAILNVVLNFVLIPHFGILGAASATAISTATWNITLAIKTRRNLGVRSSLL